MIYRNPILVFGRPRSGTTWVGKIFDSHPDTLYLHEPDTAILISDIPIIAEAADTAMDPGKALSIFENTMRLRQSRVAASLPRFPKSYRYSMLDRVHQSVSLGAKLWSHFFTEISVPDLISRSSLPAVRVVWKSIESVGRIQLISHIIPKARIILILRHPGGQISSVQKGQREKYFDDNDEDSGILNMLAESRAARRRGIDIQSFRSMSYIERSAWSWVLYNESAFNPKSVTNNVFIVKYEDVCEDPIGWSKKMFRFSGLEWSAQTEDFVKRSVSRSNERFYSVFKDPTISANKWRKLLSSCEIKVIEDIMSQSYLGDMFL